MALLYLAPCYAKSGLVALLYLAPCYAKSGLVALLYLAPFYAKTGLVARLYLAPFYTKTGSACTRVHFTFFFFTSKYSLCYWIGEFTRLVILLKCLQVSVKIVTSEVYEMSVVARRRTARTSRIRCLHSVTFWSRRSTDANRNCWISSDRTRKWSCELWRTRYLHAPASFSTPQVFFSFA